MHRERCGKPAAEREQSRRRSAERPMTCREATAVRLRINWPIEKRIERVIECVARTHAPACMRGSLDAEGTRARPRRGARAPSREKAAHMHAKTGMSGGISNLSRKPQRTNQRPNCNRPLEWADERVRVWMEALEQRRMLSDGFGVNGWSAGVFPGGTQCALPTAMATASDGKFYVVGCIGQPSYDWGLSRFNSDGTPDSRVGTGGHGTQVFSLGQRSYPDNVLVQRDGRILVTGECDNGLAIARFHEDGSLDTSFGGGAQVYDVFNGFNPSFIDF